MNGTITNKPCNHLFMNTGFSFQGFQTKRCTKCGKIQTYEFTPFSSNVKSIIL